MHSAAYNSEVRADPHGVPFGTEPTPSIFAALWLTLAVPSVPIRPSSVYPSLSLQDATSFLWLPLQVW